MRKWIPAVLLVPLVHAAGATHHFYLAPDGSDAWSCRSAEVTARQTDGPFATPQRARDAIRELKRSQAPGGTLFPRRVEGHRQ